MIIAEIDLLSLQKCLISKTQEFGEVNFGVKEIRLRDDRFDFTGVNQDREPIQMLLATGSGIRFIFSATSCMTWPPTDHRNLISQT